MLSDSPNPSKSGPLSWLTVVSLEQAVAAPFCTARLADAGARVIKVERPEGDFARAYDSVVHGESTYFVWLNRGKQSIVLDIKRREDSTLLRRIIERADVYVQNLAPGAAARCGLDSRALRAELPRLITCDISGYGERGPYHDRKAYDLLIQCETGLAEITGGPSEPGRVGVSVADICCGMNAYAGILQALVERERTGHGKSLAVSLFDGIAEWMTVPLLHQQYGGQAPKRTGISHPSIAPYGLYAARDGLRTILAVQNEREWRSFCSEVLRLKDLTNDPRFVTNGARCANRGALDAAIVGVLSQLSTEELHYRLETAKIAFASLNTVADLARHPQLRRVVIRAPSGPVELPAPSIVDHDSNRPLGGIPALGEDTERIRSEFR
jgi:itaconate CoA-transferase